jgi:sugar phosphate isomerase/epimerase
MPTLIECRDIEENMSLCKELGLDFIEINMNLPQYQIDNIDPVAYKSLLSEYGIFFTLHLPEEINIADFNPRVKEAYIKTILDSIDLAKEIGIPIINMHMNPCVYFTLPGKKIYLFDKYYGYYIVSIKEFGDIVFNSIGCDNISLSIENTGNYNLKFITTAIDELLRHSCFKLTWDIGHDHSSGLIDSSFILNNLSRVNHFHLHDAVGTENHLPLGSGEIDIQGKMDIARIHKCSCVIETKTINGLRKSVDAINKGRYHI